VEIKICGITNLEDALNAVEAGATILGYNFYLKSKRYLAPADCIQIQDGLQRRGVVVKTAGIFVNEPLGIIQQVLRDCQVDLAQLSGDERLADLLQLGARGFKAIRPRDHTEASAQMLEIPDRDTPPAVLVDTFKRGTFGGTGHTGDWDIARQLATQHPLLLAGGLNLENVGQAVELVSPWGVDVATGVESAPGVKDLDKMKRFVANAKRAANQ
jgi:phosphoribosylanthranilate isomerase